MIGRGNGKPGTHSVPGYSHARPCIQGDPTCNSYQGCPCYKTISSAQRAAIDKSQCYYFELTCGHYVPKEVREIYKVFNPIEIFCEICNNWIPPKEHVTKRDYPDNPLF